MFSKFTGFSGRETWCYQRSKLGRWYTECRKNLLLFSRSDNANGGGLTASFYSGSVEAECDYTLGKTAGIEDNNLDTVPRCLRAKNTG